MADVSIMGIQLDWLDNIKKKVHGGRELQLEFQKVVNLKINPRRQTVPSSNLESPESAGGEAG